MSALVAFTVVTSWAPTVADAKISAMVGISVFMIVRFRSCTPVFNNRANALKSSESLIFSGKRMRGPADEVSSFAQ
jgi:hypothetical protein